MTKTALITLSVFLIGAIGIGLRTILQHPEDTHTLVGSTQQTVSQRAPQKTTLHGAPPLFDFRYQGLQGTQRSAGKAEQLAPLDQ